jgi:hypothetical protein
MQVLYIYRKYINLDWKSQIRTGISVIKYTVQKRQRVCFVLHMQRKSILYVTDTLSIASFLADFYALSMSALLEYREYAGMLLLLLILIVSVTYMILSRCMRPKKNVNSVFCTLLQLKIFC